MTESLSTLDHPLTTPSDGTVLVIGGSGKTGRRVATRLTDRGIAVRGVSRSTTPAFDWEEPTTWSAALDDVQAAYVTYSPDLALPGADLQVAALASEFASRGITRVVLLSGRGEEGAAAAEDAQLAQVPTARVVQAAWFAQNVTEGLLAGYVADGTIALPVSASVPEPFVDLDDLADVVVRVLLDDTTAGRRYAVTGPEAITFDQVAATLADRLSRPIQFVQVSAEEFVAQARAAGVSEDEAYGLTGLFAELFDGRNVSPTATVTQLLGREPRSFATFVADAVATGSLR